jgi:hypothetical protein
MRHVFWPDCPKKVTARTSRKMVQVFISCRFGEALPQAEMLKAALEKADVTCFLCSVHSGDSIGDAVVDNLDSAELVVILGTRTYGQKTDCNFSTYNELKFVVDAKKPFFLVKMCDRFEVSNARFRLLTDTAHSPWPEKDHARLPPTLVPEIMEKLRIVSAPPTPAMSRLVVSPAKQSVEEQLKELKQAGDDKDYGRVVEILCGATNEKVASQGCAVVRKLASGNADNKVQLARLGGCEAVVNALKKWGATNENVAENGCGAVGNLASGNADNQVQLARLGAADAVRKCLDNPFKEFAIQKLAL